MRKIRPCLWFDGNAEEAMNFYLSIFKNSKVLDVSHYGDAGPGTKGSVLSVTFELDGQEFMGLNGGPHYKFTPATSFFVTCKTQEEVDYYWEKLSAGGEPGRCGWLTDKYGVSWQIVPTALGEMLQDENPEKSRKATQAMLSMNKLDIAGLKRAHEG